MFNSVSSSVPAAPHRRPLQVRTAPGPPVSRRLGKEPSNLAVPGSGRQAAALNHGAGRPATTQLSGPRHLRGIY